MRTSTPSPHAWPLACLMVPVVLLTTDSGISIILRSPFSPQVLLLSMRDMNIAKLTSVDVPLFNAIVQDLFPNIELPVIDYGKVFVPPPPLPFIYLF